MEIELEEIYKNQQKRRQSKIDEAIEQIENRIKEFKTEIDYFNINQNFCPYKVASAIEAMQEHKNYLEIVKTLKK